MDSDFAEFVSKTFDIDFSKEIANLIFSFDLEKGFELYFDHNVKSNFKFIMNINYRTFYDEIIYDYQKHCYKDSSNMSLYMNLDENDTKKLKMIIRRINTRNMFG